MDTRHRTLDASAASPLASAQASPNPDAPPPRTILLIEDHKDSASVLATVLRMEGYRVHCAKCAREALHLASTQPFDFIITDLRLPDADGRDLMHHLHAAYHLPGIAMSGDDALLADKPRLHHAGFLAVVPKPIEFRDLLAAVHMTACQSLTPVSHPRS